MWLNEIYLDEKNVNENIILNVFPLALPLVFFFKIKKNL